MDYKEWNDEIAGRFFREDHAGERVYLHVSRDLIQRIGKSRGLDKNSCLDDFVTATQERHRYSDNYGVAEAALRWLKVENAWDELWSEGCPYPPYIGYLGLFVLAAGYNPEGKFAPVSYYERLNSLLGRTGTSKPKKFEKIQKVWEHLEKWANQDQKGRLGIFEIQYIDERSHVGIPNSQKILTEHDRKVAKWVFSKTGLHPDLTPSKELVASLMRKRGRQKLRGRTYDVLAPDTEYPKYRQALLEALLDILQNWDGTPVELDEKEEQKTTSYPGSLTMSISKSPFGEIVLQLRCILDREFPEGELVLQDKEGHEYTCREVMSGWSTPLHDRNDNLLDPSSLNWSERFTLEDPDQDWKFLLRPSKVRVFLKGKEKGVPTVGAYLETGQLPLRTTFYLLVQESEREAIEDWGRSSCKGFEHVSSTNLPESWRLYRSDGAIDDEGVRGRYNAISQPRKTQIALEGGVRVRPRTNEYFTFAPPRIRVRGIENIDVHLDEVPLEKAPGGLYEVPAELRSDGEHVVVARAEQEVVKRKYFSLREQTQWREVPEVTLDKFGFVMEMTSDESQPEPTGENLDLQETPLNLDLHLLRDFDSKVYLLGSTPGQVTEWPSEELPEEWQSVWIVPPEGRAKCCWPGKSPPDPKPVPSLSRPGGPRYERSNIKKWKEVLYHWRRRTDPPHRHVELWKRYRRHAEEKC
ncbi:hypothetical protein GGP53_001026 [Salinibacter ruber]|uniref:hypothetical protein n=1 Tax=Salinibacter ruber TaxID=146919 RepID=UPI0021697630|nr:hypothetical protein [Salinibacter ruber]MCS3627185.1 hypothetical protein [Salinibacter ruber]MCS4144092.1 hypothetical protein [Salinibacter ruber]